MGRLLAIDYGSKRTGIAITDELQLIASGYFNDKEKVCQHRHGHSNP